MQTKPVHGNFVYETQTKRNRDSAGNVWKHSTCLHLPIILCSSCKIKIHYQQDRQHPEVLKFKSQCCHIVFTILKLWYQFAHCYSEIPLFLCCICCILFLIRLKCGWETESCAELSTMKYLSPNADFSLYYDMNNKCNLSYDLPKTCLQVHFCLFSNVFHDYSHCIFLLNSKACIFKNFTCLYKGSFTPCKSTPLY